MTTPVAPSRGSRCRTRKCSSRPNDGWQVHGLPCRRRRRRAESLVAAVASEGLRNPVIHIAAGISHDHDASIPGCAVFDVSMPGLDGLELQQALTAEGSQRPVIFLTGKGDIPTSVRAMRAGAIDFLTKPVSDRDLLAAIARAEKEDAETRQRPCRTEFDQCQDCTPDAAGTRSHDPRHRRQAQQANSRRFGNSREDHQGPPWPGDEKLGVRSVADLVRLAEKAGISRNGDGPCGIDLRANSTIRLADADSRSHDARIPPWIAIVDDDPSVLKALARLLKARGIRGRTFTSARDFLTSLPDGRPECLIVDLQMPEMDGLELQHHLTNGIRIPTIVITAHNEGEMRERCKSMGASDFLSKPLQDTSLLAAIDKAKRIDARDRRARNAEDDEA